MARHAATAIAAGELDVVLLTYGSTARSDVKRRVRGSAAAMGTGGACSSKHPTVQRSSPSMRWPRDGT